MGVDLDHFFESSPTRQVTISSLSEARLTDALIGSKGLTAQESAFERRDIVRAIAERLDDGAYLADIERLADHVRQAPGIVKLPSEGRGGETLQTTEELLEVERILMERAATLRTADVAKVDGSVTAQILSERPELSSEQRAMVSALTSSGAGVAVVVGKAGAGKTTALSIARQSFEAAGLRVTGTALSARATEELESSAGLESVTLARLDFELEEGMRVLGPDDVLVVDEAGMVGTRTIARLIDVTGPAGAKLILVGDHRQLAEIDTGGAFAALATRLGATELSEHRRQQALWERGALDQLRSGDVRTALSAYEAHGRINLAPTMAQARSVLVEQWLSARSDGAEAFMLTVGRRDVDALNVLARTMLQKLGAVAADQVTIGERPFAQGEEVVCLRNARRLGVLNGTRGTITDIDDVGVTISTPKGERTLPHRYVGAGHLDYGYATTVHKAQGATYDRAFVLATEALSREAGYVAMSRARIGTDLFVAGGAFEHGHGPDYAADEPMERTAARLATSRAKKLALSHLGDGIASEPLPNPPLSELNGERGEEGHAMRSQIETPSAGSRDPRWDTDFSGADQPNHIIAALGARPAFIDEQAGYDTVADAIERFRRRHDVSGDEPLGDRPFSVIPRLEFDAVAAQIHAYERFRWRELDPPALDLSRDLGLGR
jgi:Ti-type conjugative transfer relaxase TraA